MDVLSEILDKVELTSSYWYRTSFAGDWGISLPQEENLARFHIVTHGEFWYEVPKLKLKSMASQGEWELSALLICTTFGSEFKNG